MKFSKSKISTFAYGLFTRLTINIENFLPLAGQLFASELFALFSLPFLRVRKLFREYEGLRLVTVCFLILLVSQIFSDIVNQSAPADYLRGWALIGFSLVSTFFFVGHLSKKPESIVYYIAGLMIVNAVFGQGELDFEILEENTNYFKERFTGFINPIIILGSYFFYSKNRRWSAVFLILLYGIIAVALDARSTGGVFLLSGLLLSIKVYGIRLNRFKLGVSAILITGILYSGYVIYVNQVLNHGFGGANAQSQVTQAENPYNPFDLLMAGRGEVAVAIFAISDKPLIGHGSWAKDKTGKYQIFTENLIGSPNIRQSEIIRSHSVIFTAWLWAGLAGFLSIGLIFIYMGRVFIKIFISYSNIYLMPIIILMFITITWHFLFSPYGHLRTDFPAIFALLTILNPSKL